jgi:sugar-specific transcriptional regulator TrmB
MIEQTLQEIGLTQNEIKVYLALLDTGESKTGEILKRSGLNSGKIYEILDSLQKKGFASFVVKSGVKYFSPADPKRVLDYLEEKKQAIARQEQDYQQVLPEILKRVSQRRTGSRIEIFTGLKGMKTAYSKELDFPKEQGLDVLGVMPSKYYSKPILDFFYLNHHKKRQHAGYRIRKILANEKESRNKEHERGAEIRFLPITSLVSVNVIGNLTIIGIFTEELIFITVESQEVAESFREQFRLLWKAASE